MRLLGDIILISFKACNYCRKINNSNKMVPIYNYNKYNMNSNTIDPFVLL